MYSKAFVMLIVFVTQVSARPPNPADECVLGDNTTCPRACSQFDCVPYVCIQTRGCSAPPGPCNPPTICVRADEAGNQG
ncbi:hypothetical protein Ddc_12980 [Ditylenchus destructor]|nr:hypothetical protein Ddc_12980 [Ditylenchus destructor]